MKVLVVYYSLEGNTKLLAEKIAETVGANTDEIIPETKIGKGAMKYLWGGSQVAMRKLPKIQSSGIDPNDYDVIFLGTPVWAWTSSPPLNSYLKENRISGKKIALFCTNEGNKGKTFQKLREGLKGNEILGEFESFAPIKKDREDSVNKAVSWARSLLK